MNKLKSLKNWQKGLLVVLGIVLVGLIGLGVGKLVSTTATPEVAQAEFENLIESTYTVSDFAEDGVEAKMNIKMDSIGEDDLKTLAQNIFDKAKKSKWTQERIYLNVFTTDPKSDFNFYTDGLYGTILIDTEKQSASIGKFVDVPAVKKANTEKMLEAKNELVTNNEGKVVISLDMAIDNSEAIVMEQSLAYTDVVRTINKGIESIQLNINPNADKSFETHTDFDKVIKSVDKIKLAE